MSEPATGSKTAGALVPPASEGKGAERRGAPRYPFIASVEITDLGTGAQLAARTTDLSLTGCYVDTIMPLGTGSCARLRLTHGQKSFEALAAVHYAQPGMGMGMAFTEIQPDQQQVLQSWVSVLSGELAPAPESSEVSSSILRFPRTERAILCQLISLLIRKGTLSEAEGAALLRELAD